MKRWLTLDANTFVFYDKEKVLFINTNLNKLFEIINNKYYIKLIESLNNINNLYCVEINDYNYNKYFDSFHELSRHGIASITYSNYSDRSISLPPKIKIHCDIKRINKDYNNHCAGYIRNFLNEITIHLNGSNDEIANNIYLKQTIFPMEGNQKLSCDNLINFFETIRYNNLLNINIVSNIEIIKEFDRFIDYIIDNEYNLNFYFRNSTSLLDCEIINKLMTKGRINIISFADEPIYNNNFNCVFLVKNFDEVTSIESKVSIVPDYEIVPIYLDNNSEFFEKYIYTHISDNQILRNKKRNIFSNQIINTNFFGKLIILPNNKIHSNLNFEFIGDMNTSLDDLTYRALNTSESWRITREKIDPCIDCRYKYVCPPISNYEFALKKFNLCNIK